MTSIGYYNSFGYSSSTSNIFAFNPYDNTYDGTKNNPYIPSL